MCSNTPRKEKYRKGSQSRGSLFPKGPDVLNEWAAESSNVGAKWSARLTLALCFPPLNSVYLWEERTQCKCHVATFAWLPASRHNHKTSINGSVVLWVKRLNWTDFVSVFHFVYQIKIVQLFMNVMMQPGTIFQRLASFFDNVSLASYNAKL